MFRRFINGKQKTFHLNRTQSLQQALPYKRNIKYAAPFTPSIDRNIQYIRDHYKNCCDLIEKQFIIHGTNIRCALFFFEADADTSALQEYLLQSLMTRVCDSQSLHNIEEVRQRVLTLADVKPIEQLDIVHIGLLSGNAVLFIDGATKPFFINIKNVLARSVGAPSTETAIYGPKEAFVENIRVNTVLIRQRIKSDKLAIEEFIVGDLTQTTVRLFYLKGVARDEIINEARERLQSAKVDSVISSEAIRELLTDNPFNIFDTLQSTERSDTAVDFLLDGRFAIAVDGSPFVQTGPAVFSQFFKASEDYYTNYFYATFIRTIRIICYCISLLVPSLYIALLNFHIEMIPLPLLISLLAQRELAPFPSTIEYILIEGTFEILKEASIRLPAQISGTISLVGALIIGQGAVSAGLITPAVTIVVAVTALASFTFESYSFTFSLRMMRYILILFAIFFGMYGIAVGCLLFILKLCSIKTFGIPYLGVDGPFTKQTLYDGLIRAPLKKYPRRRDLFVKKHKQKGETS